MLDLKTVFTLSDDEVELTIGPVGEYVSGAAKLAQSIIHLFLTDTGTSEINPGVGANIKALTIGTTKNSVETTKGLLTTKIMETESYVVGNQIGIDLPDEEKLLSLKIISLEYNEELVSWDIRVLMETVAGTYYPITLS